MSYIANNIVIIWVSVNFAHKVHNTAVCSFKTYQWHKFLHSFKAYLLLFLLYFQVLFDKFKFALFIAICTNVKVTIVLYDLHFHIYLTVGVKQLQVGDPSKTFFIPL